MPCPQCASDNLRIKAAKGLEYIVLLFITKRLYTCRDCETVFRAPDRRQARRNDDATSASMRRA